ncbi:Phloem protein 2-B5 [Heracleum sosnowskyi]|uniref:Phloem protein 2-B5 n=1 Tax=Heracleum sosnowskyi TaxID=360622 RepID=A0AAD8JBI4_9APIA|nr:Phloem protein 2-B5 [Heracleum sosnowskyi]
MELDLLPEDCIAHVLSCTSPQDACRAALTSPLMKDVANSDFIWNAFLPSDYQEIISRSTSPVSFKSKKELFMKLTSPLLIDGGTKTISLDKVTGKKCYMLCARELHITWSGNSLYWSWKHLLQSRFAEVSELVMVCWLELSAKMNTRMLSENTFYGAFLVVKFADRAFGLDQLPSEVLIEVGNSRYEGTICLCHSKSSDRIRERSDGWMEIEIGFFHTDDAEKHVKISLKEVKGVHLKGGLIVEGIEVRPM